MKKYELSTQQKNIWNLQKYYEHTAISNICGAITYDEMRDTEGLKEALRQVVRNAD